MENKETQTYDKVLEEARNNMERSFHIVILAEKLLVSIASDPSVECPDIEFCFATAVKFTERTEKFLASQKEFSAIKERLSEKMS